MFLAVLALMAACKGGDTGPVAPDPSLGPATSVTLCGSTSEPRDPCDNFPENEIQMIVNGGNGISCPCFTFTLLNQNLSDEGTSNRNYGFLGFRSGTYQVSGQMNTAQLGFNFMHNTSTSAIGVVPSSIQSLSGPTGTPFRDCSVQYNAPNPSQRPASFSFQFTVAAAADGGSC